MKPWHIHTIIALLVAILGVFGYIAYHLANISINFDTIMQRSLETALKDYKVEYLEE